MTEQFQIIPSTDYRTIPPSINHFSTGFSPLTCLASMFGEMVPINFWQNSVLKPGEIQNSESELEIIHDGCVTMFLYIDKSINHELAHNLRVLQDIENLQENWNGHGAHSFSKRIIKTVRDIIIPLERQPSIFPTARDSIQMEYEKDNGDYLEFELFEAGQLKKFSYSSNDEASTEYISFDDIGRIVNEFY